jgi:uncharacterized membrane protein
MIVPHQERTGTIKFREDSDDQGRRKNNMPKFLSATVSNAFNFIVLTMLGTLLFFTIIGVFGIWMAVGGLLFAVTLTSAIVGRFPAEEEMR